MRVDQSELRGSEGIVVGMRDYATPSFFTFPKEYCGTPAMLRDYLDARKKLTPDFRETDVHCKAASILAVKETRIAPFRLDHVNVWGCVYHIRADQCAAKLAYIKTADRYCRCVLAEFWNPTYEGRPFRGMFWGQPAMLAYESGRLYNRLMYLEKQFQSEAEILADTVHPGEINFNGFFDDVFGDG